MRTEAPSPAPPARGVESRDSEPLMFAFHSPRRLWKMGRVRGSSIKVFLTFIMSCVLFLFLSSSGHALDVPKLQGYVNDYAAMISPPVRAELNNELGAFEQSDSTQIVILTVPSLEGEALEDFSIKVAEAWKIGQKNKDNGAILLVAKQERKIRIEVGRGLEGRLTDLMSGRIIDLVMKPRFKRGDFDGGFVAGVSALIDATRGEFKADGHRDPQKHNGFSQIFTFLIFGGIILLALGSFSRILGGIAGAVGLPFLVYLGGFSIGLILLIILAVAGLGIGVILPALFSSGGRYGGGGFWPGGGFSGMGGGSGGGDFGGGFSGGGGDFGGGGASGDW